MAMKEARLPSVGELAKAVQEGAAREKGAEGGVEASNEQRITQLRQELSSLEGEIKAAEKDVEILQAEDGDESEVDPEVLKDDLAQLDAAIADLQAKEARREALMTEIATLETSLDEGIAEEAPVETQKLHETVLPTEDRIAVATELAEAVPANDVDEVETNADLPSGTLPAMAEVSPIEPVAEAPQIDPETQARIDENRKDQAEIQAKRDQAYEQHRSTETARKRNLGPEKAEEYALIEDSINKAGVQLEKLRKEVEAGDEEVYKINKELYQSENGRRFLTRSYALDLIKGVREAKREGRSSLLPEQANNLEHLAKLYREYNSEAKMNLEEDVEGYMKRDEKSLADQENALTSYVSSMNGQRSELFKQQREAEKILHRNKNALRDLGTEYNELIDRSNQLRAQSGITNNSPAEWRKFKTDQFLENLKVYRGAIGRLEE